MSIKHRKTELGGVFGVRRTRRSVPSSMWISVHARLPDEWNGSSSSRTSIGHGLQIRKRPPIWPRFKVRVFRPKASLPLQLRSLRWESCDISSCEVRGSLEFRLRLRHDINLAVGYTINPLRVDGTDILHVILSTPNLSLARFARKQFERGASP